jgi:hypothetical protein
MLLEGRGVTGVIQGEPFAQDRFARIIIDDPNGRDSLYLLGFCTSAVKI